MDLIDSSTINKEDNKIDSPKRLLLFDKIVNLFHRKIIIFSLVILVGIVLTVIFCLPLFFSDNKTKSSNSIGTIKTSLTIKPTAVQKTSPSPTVEIIFPTTIPTPIPTNSPITITGDYYFFHCFGLDLPIASNGILVTIKNKLTGTELFTTNNTAVWTFTLPQPGEYLVTYHYEGEYTPMEGSCTGATSCKESSDNFWNNELTVDTGQQIHIRKYLYPYRYYRQDAFCDNVQYANDKPQVKLISPGNGQNIDLPQGQTQLCFVDIPESNAKDLLRRTNVNDDSWTDYNNKYPCFPVKQGGNKLQIQYKNAGNFESDVKQIEFNVNFK